MKKVGFTSEEELKAQQTAYALLVDKKSLPDEMSPVVISKNGERGKEKSCGSNISRKKKRNG